MSDKQTAAMLDKKLKKIAHPPVTDGRDERRKLGAVLVTSMGLKMLIGGLLLLRG